MGQTASTTSTEQIGATPLPIPTPLDQTSLRPFIATHGNPLYPLPQQQPSDLQTQSLYQSSHQPATLSPQPPPSPPPLATTTPAATQIGPPPPDGFRWRKYGQKEVKGNEFPRSYYKCTFPGCEVRKKFEKAVVDNRVTDQVVYKGEHTHGPPHITRLNAPDQQTFKKSVITEVVATDAPKSESIEDEAWHASEPLPSSPVLERPTDNQAQTLALLPPPVASSTKLVVETNTNVDHLDDGYHWRKYGEKKVKDSIYPRSYYKCTEFPRGCPVKKQVERSATSVLNTYEGTHNHAAPSIDDPVSEKNKKAKKSGDQVPPPDLRTASQHEPAAKRQNTGATSQQSAPVPPLMHKLKQPHDLLPPPIVTVSPRISPQYMHPLLPAGSAQPYPAHSYTNSMFVPHGNFPFTAPPLSSPNPVNAGALHHPNNPSLFHPTPNRPLLPATVFSNNPIPFVSSLQPINEPAQGTAALTPFIKLPSLLPPRTAAPTPPPLPND